MIVDEARQHAARLDTLTAILAAQREPHRVVDLVAAAGDDDAARAAVAAGLGVSETGARAVLDMQVRRLNGAQRAAIDAEIGELRARIADLPE
jgi:DNA gyrase/topoisomerase IV subunit A